MSLSSMLSEVAAHYEVAPWRLRQPDRRHEIAHPRHAFMWLARQVKWPDGSHRYSLPQIGQFLGGMNHTSVLHGVRQHERRLRAGGYPQVRANIVDAKDAPVNRLCDAVHG